MGRVYPLTSYLHEQSDDFAKSLILHARGSALGAGGLYWLLLHGANSFGYDKESLDDRVSWCLERYEELLSYGRAPTTNLGWIKADKAWSFLAFCKELVLLQSWVNAGNKEEDFVSNLVCFIDG